MGSVEVKLLIHEHPMTPLKDSRRGNCCGIKFEAISDGYYCSECDFFFHKTCSNTPKWIQCPFSHNRKAPLSIISNVWYHARCDLCREVMRGDICYYCDLCRKTTHLDCAKYPPGEVIRVSKNHDHKLELEKEESCFTCAKCGKQENGYSYKCHECDFTFHVNCGKYESEVTHPSHSLHPLKLFQGDPPAYTGGKCRLCGGKLDDGVFYHCSKCNFSLDLHCVHDPPRQHTWNRNIHHHELTLVPKLISFACTVCGLAGDRSPYACLKCDFMVHNDCSDFPILININRHKHRVSRTSLIGVVNSTCGVCRMKMDWSCGGFYCKRCPGDVFHAKCATRGDVWDGKELIREPEEEEDIEPFKVTDENTIQHIIHCYHKLRLDKSDIFIEERICSACVYPIYFNSFYSCLSCNFKLHKSCANLPIRKRHMVSLTPDDLYQDFIGCYRCEACGLCSNGFKYGTFDRALDVRCATISQPFFHQSHPDHPLFYTSPNGVCSGCNTFASHVLRCVEDNCGYILDFKCALLPYEVKHRVDDHILSLRYGEKATGKYWCDICEKETDPTKWFYTCKVCGVTLHTNCVLGEFRAFDPGRELTTRSSGMLSLTVRNNSMSRPLCNQCKSHCIFPIILKVVEDDMPDKNYCSINCFDTMYLGTIKYKYSIFQ